jgi:hypothetical protein
LFEDSKLIIVILLTITMIHQFCPSHQQFNCSCDTKKQTIDGYCSTHSDDDCNCNPENKQYDHYCDEHFFAECNCKNQKVSYDGFISLKRLKSNHDCYRCMKPNATVYDVINCFNGHDWFHRECPKLCKNGHNIEEYIPAYYDGVHNRYHVYHCVEGCEVDHSDVYPTINSGDYYNY